MGILPSDFTYDLEWPVKKINLGRSVHGIEYHPDMQVHALLSSVTVSFRLHDDNGEPIVGEYGMLYIIILDVVTKDLRVLYFARLIYRCIDFFFFRGSEFFTQVPKIYS